MDYSKIDFKDIVLKEQVFIINKETDFYSIRYDIDDILKIETPKFKTFGGIKTNVYGKDEINISVDEKFKQFIQEIETYIQEISKDIISSEQRQFKSILKKYKDFPEFIKINVDKKSKYPDDLKNKEIITTFTITGIWCNSKNYGISIKLNKIKVSV